MEKTDEFTFGFRAKCKHRGHPLPSADTWLAAKRDEDATEGYWRIHDSYYDFASFQHPGGQDWLITSKGTDITEMFESSHPNIDKSRALLSKYIISDIKPRTPRNSAFTFSSSGFYCTLRKHAWDILQVVGRGPTVEILTFHTSLLAAFLILLAGSVVCEVRSGICLAVAAGVTLALLMMCSHNFYHQKDNWRMFCWDLTPYSSYEWRITHAYSHHTYPNSANDFEVTSLEKFVNYYPLSLKQQQYAKPLHRYFLMPLFLQFVFLSIFWISLFRKAVGVITRLVPLRWENLLPVALWIALILLRVVLCSSSESIYQSMYVAFCRLMMCYGAASSTFHNISLGAGHHHPQIWHAGDTIVSKDGTIDWGLFQLAAVGDRPDVDATCLASSVCFGRHALHHLFPTVDHSKLNYLLPALRMTCKQFGVTYFPESSQSSQRHLTIIDSYLGMWRQAWRSLPSADNYVSWKEM